MPWRIRVVVFMGINCFTKINKMVGISETKKIVSIFLFNGIIKTLLFAWIRDIKLQIIYVIIVENAAPLMPYLGTNKILRIRFIIEEIKILNKTVFDLPAIERRLADIINIE